MRNSVRRDWQWANRFLPHQKEIAEKAVRVEVADIEDDLRRNTDLILRSVVPVGHVGEIRFSARVRRHEFIRRGSRATGRFVLFRDQFTIRYDRPNNVIAEMRKMLDGYGDFFIYGFESLPDSDRMRPWFIGNLALLREYVINGGRYHLENNKDGSSRLAIFNLADMPHGFIFDQDPGIEQAEAIWESIPGYGRPIAVPDDFELARQFAEAAAWNRRIDEGG